MVSNLDFNPIISMESILNSAEEAIKKNHSLDNSNDYIGIDRREPERWRVKKEISITSIIALLSAGLSIVYAYSTLDKRLSILEVAQVSSAQADKNQQADLSKFQDRMNVVLDSINVKLDRIIEHNSSYSNGNRDK